MQFTRPRPSWLNNWIWCELSQELRIFMNHLSIAGRLVAVNEARAPRLSWRAGCGPYRRKNTRIHPGRAWHMNRNSSPRCSAKLTRKQYQTPVSKGWDLISTYSGTGLQEGRANWGNCGQIIGIRYMWLYDHIWRWIARGGPRFGCLVAWRFFVRFI